jgi:hypothetical protein
LVIVCSIFLPWRVTIVIVAIFITASIFGSFLTTISITWLIFWIWRWLILWIRRWAVVWRIRGGSIYWVWLVVRLLGWIGLGLMAWCLRRVFGIIGSLR